MDLNRLFSEHQTSLIRAAAARCDAASAGHRQDAARHAGAIGALRARLGAKAPLQLLRA